MINKKNLWFLTLFSLVLVLSVYYVTMPNDLLAAAKSSTNLNGNEKKVNIKESDVISALRVEDDSKTKESIVSLQETIADNKSTTEEKNNAYESLKQINNNNSLEETIEKGIKEDLNCNAFAKIGDKNSIRVVVDGCENSKSIANDIMNIVQNNFDDKMYISVEFKS